MAWERSKPIPEKAKCRICEARYAQRLGLCATCWRSEDGERQAVTALEAEERLAKEIAIEKLKRSTPERPRRELIINGQAWEVVFDGS